MSNLIIFAFLASAYIVAEASFGLHNPHHSIHPLCDKAADIVFLVDDSRSIWYEHFAQELDFVQRLSARFHISSYKTRFAAVAFSSGVREIFPFGRFDTQYEVRNALGSIYQSSGSTTDTYKGIQYVREYIFPHARTDGGSQERVQARREATLAKLSGIQIFVIGIGKYLEPYHLEELASEPAARYLYSVSSFPKLLNVDLRIAEQVCLGRKAFIL
ncbi:collagen alpha-1(xii) chain [Plakobranchus ocellatus]|uniref:Collagen alpha-1(Xii) chain n=1 Tax=Plakobranchus ocellatus TaxID=259542 RepID=A0AAV3ZWE0_9GAST|nr:collagen alpha-1(xii) chain [Plakobranchus ocellatus]